MFKALAALAVSMTLAAALLSWLEPRRTLALSQPYVDAMVHSAVRAADSLSPTEWQGVEIVTSGREAWRGQTLAAMRPADGYHFEVTARGEVQPLPDWQRQKFDGDGGTIRIRVQGAAARADQLDPQWVSLRSLLAQLQSLGAAEGRTDGIPWFITLSGDDDEVSGLRALLVREGLLS